MGKDQGKTLVGRLDKPVFMFRFGIIYENQMHLIFVFFESVVKLKV